MNIAWLECKCTILTCMKGEPIVIWCPTHDPNQTIRRELWEQELRPQKPVPVGGV